LYNLVGERVATLTCGEDLHCGWDTGQAATGLYFARIQVSYADGTSETIMRKLLIVP
jgi:hypothetical protein